MGGYSGRDGGGGRDAGYSARDGGGRDGGDYKRQRLVRAKIVLYA